eukprot:11308272-Prorocentrum_lima.AAC.1
MHVVVLFGAPKRTTTCIKVARSQLTDNSRHDTKTSRVSGSFVEEKTAQREESYCVLVNSNWLIDCLSMRPVAMSTFVAG